MRMIVLAVIVAIIFQVMVVVFAASADSRSVRNLPKWAWVLACLVFPVLGGICYLVLGRPIVGANGNTGGAKGQTKTVAPDDDPEFLRELKRRIEDEQNGSSENQ